MHTPNIDGLAARGVTFRHAYNQCTISSTPRPACVLWPSSDAPLPEQTPSALRAETPSCPSTLIPFDSTWPHPFQRVWLTAIAAQVWQASRHDPRVTLRQIFLLILTPFRSTGLLIWRSRYNFKDDFRHAPGGQDWVSLPGKMATLLDLFGPCKRSVPNIASRFQRSSRTAGTTQRDAGRPTTPATLPTGTCKIVMLSRWLCGSR